MTRRQILALPFAATLAAQIRYREYARCLPDYLSALAFAPMRQGERPNYPRPGCLLPPLGSPTDEHIVPGRQMLLTGATATGMQLWDGIRSLDVLAAHPQVDPKRLASTGQSGGATL